MQAVIEAGRAIREKNNRPLKQPLRRVVVVHPDPDFLADITGGLLCFYVVHHNRSRFA
jgi:isoleucyl-tRNA synthetase